MVDLREVLHAAAPPAPALAVDRLEHAVRRRRRRRRVVVGTVALAFVVLGAGLFESVTRKPTTIQTTAPGPSLHAAPTTDATTSPSPALAPCPLPLAARDVPVGWSHELLSGSGGESADPSALGHWSGGRGHYVDILGPSNGWYPLPLTRDLPDSEPIQVLGSPAQLGSVHEGYAVAVVLPGPPPCGLLLTGYGLTRSQLGALAESMYIPDPGSARPSQSPADAERDGVLPEVAALGLDRRSQREASVVTDEGRWVLSRAPAPFPDGCTLGDTAGTYGIDFVCMPEYGEVLLVDDAGTILKAYPMPGVPPKWMQITDDAVYGGAIGDGALPDSTVFRIDRRTRTMELIYFRHPESTPRRLPQPWRTATAGETSRYSEVLHIGADGTGTPVTSTIGPVLVNLELLVQMFR